MKVYYRQCKKCKKLKPYLTYFLSKEENERLSEEDRLLCYECYILKGVNQMSIVTIEKVVENWWNNLDFEEKYEIYCNTEDEDEPTDEEKRMNAGDIEAHRRMVEGDEIE